MVEKQDKNKVNQWFISFILIMKKNLILQEASKSLELVVTEGWTWKDEYEAWVNRHLEVVLKK